MKRDTQLRIAIIIGTVALAATTFATSAYASAAFGNLGKNLSKTPHTETSRHNKGAGANMYLKFPDFDLKMKPSKSRGKKNGKGHDVGPNTNVPEDHGNKPTPPQTPTPDATPPTAPQAPAPGTGWRPDNWADQPYNPYGGLYGPGT
jgi:hypothetical protein